MPDDQHRDLVLKALKDFQRSRENRSALPELLTGESDRGAVILVSSLAEDLLADRIIERLPNGEMHREALLRQGGILSSFQDKLVMGQVLEIIEEDTVLELDILRQMRNACAHSRLGITLDTPVLKDAFRLLLGGEASEAVARTPPRLTRVIFNFLAVYYFELLGGATREQAQASFDHLTATFTEGVRTSLAKRRASPEKPS